MNIEIKLTEKELQQIVIDHFAAKTGWEIKGVRFNITSAYEDRPCGGSFPVLGETIITAKMT